MNDVTENVPAFQALPGATPENSAFIDLYFDPSVKGYPKMSKVSLVVNDYQLWLAIGQSVRIAIPSGAVSIVVQHLDLVFYTSTARLDFFVRAGQIMPVFYRASRFKNNPGSLTFQRLEGLSPSERRNLSTMKIAFAIFLGMTILMVTPIVLLLWFLFNLGSP